MLEYSICGWRRCYSLCFYKKKKEAHLRVEMPGKSAWKRTYVLTYIPTLRTQCVFKIMCSNDGFEVGAMWERKKVYYWTRAKRSARCYYVNGETQNEAIMLLLLLRCNCEPKNDWIFCAIHVSLDVAPSQKFRNLSGFKFANRRFWTILNFLIDGFWNSRAAKCLLGGFAWVLGIMMTWYVMATFLAKQRPEVSSYHTITEVKHLELNQFSIGWYLLGSGECCCTRAIKA